MILMVVSTLQDKSLVLTLVNHKQNFAWVCITMVILVICLLTEKKYKFKADDKNVNFPTWFRRSII